MRVSEFVFEASFLCYPGGIGTQVFFSFETYSWYYFAIIVTVRMMIPIRLG